MFPSLATPENMTRNNVSATIFPSLARPLHIATSFLHPTTVTSCQHKYQQSGI